MDLRPGVSRPETKRGCAGNTTLGRANLAVPADTGISAPGVGVPTPGQDVSNRIRERPATNKREDAGEGGKDAAVPR